MLWKFLEHCSQGRLAHICLWSAENKVVSASNPSRPIYMPLDKFTDCCTLSHSSITYEFHQNSSFLLFQIVIKDNETGLILKSSHYDNPFITYLSVQYTKIILKISCYRINQCGTYTFTIHSYRHKLVLFFVHIFMQTNPQNTKILLIHFISFAFFLFNLQEKTH